MRHQSPLPCSGVILMTTVLMTLTAPLPLMAAPPAPLPLPLPLQDPWEESYAGVDATGPHVLACWKFDDLPLGDPTGHGMNLTLDGARTNAQGRFGGGLSCRGPGTGARTAADTAQGWPRHSPAGAFSAEMWVRLEPGEMSRAAAHLLDKMGATQLDYRWGLQAADERDLRRMVVVLGFGTHTREFVSEPVLLPEGVWRHLAFTYDGAGKVEFHVDAEVAGSVVQAGCGAVAAGPQRLCIGDGLTNYGGFHGDVDEVRLCAGVRGFAPCVLEADGPRHVWRRMEKATPLKARLTHLGRKPLKGAEMTYSVAGSTQSFILPDLQPGESHEAEIRPDTDLRPGTYTLEVVMGREAQRVSRVLDFQVMPRGTPALPLVMDGARVEDLPYLRELGCTHWTGLTNADAPVLGPGDRHYPPKVQPRLDAGLEHGLGTVAALAPWRVLMPDARQHRVNREGQPYVPADLNAYSGSLAELGQSAGQRMMVAYREALVWSGVWLGASPRAGAQPGFSAAEREAYQKHAGTEIPAEVMNGGGVDWRTLPDFPADRVLPEDHPLLKYYRWFWSEGSGWKRVNELWYQGMDKRRQERTDVWTLHDTAVRQPSISGTDGVVNHLGDQPMDARDPLLAGLCADQLQARSAAHGREISVFGILPLSWERETVSPLTAEGTAEGIHAQDRAAPARHISMAPTILQENVWMMLARPVKGLLCTGWPALREGAPNASAVRATHPHAYQAFRDMTEKVIRPLGPMLAQRKVWKSPVVMLESFTSQMFAGRGLYRGASPRTLEVWRALQHAHVQTDLVYEELLGAGGLDDRQILILTECDVLPAGAVEQIRRWQEGGGKILADEHLCPGLKADALLPKAADFMAADAARPAPAADAAAAAAPSPAAAAAGSVPAPSLTNDASSAPVPAAALTYPQALAKACEDLGWLPRVRCDHPDVILHATSNGEAMCLFVINDHREAGTYVGQHGLVKERGLPAIAALNLGSESVNVYDLTRGQFVLPKREDAGLTVPLRLSPGEGRVFLISPAPLLDLTLDLPETATCGNVAEVVVKVTSSGGKPMPAAIPVMVSIRDADGAAAEWDGPNVVVDGTLTLRLELARNETPGTWEVRVRELASGIETVKWMRVGR